MSFETHEQNGLVWLTSPMLKNVSHGFSTRKGGVSKPPFDALNLGISRGDDPGHVTENYCRFCAVLGADPQQVVLSQQTHNTNIRKVTPQDAGKGLWHQRDYEKIDALITDAPGLVLTVFSADCGNGLFAALLKQPDDPCIILHGSTSFCCFVFYDGNDRKRLHIHYSIL